jgi:hypothetical protein
MVQVNGKDAVRFIISLHNEGWSYDNEYDAIRHVILKGDTRAEIMAVNKKGDTRKVKLAIPKLLTMNLGSVKVIDTEYPRTRWAEFSDDTNRENLESAVLSFIICYKMLSYEICPKHPYSKPLQLVLD